MRRYFCTLLIFTCSLAGLCPRESLAEFFGKVPTGLLELRKKHVYYLYVPGDYSPEKPWPLVMLLGKGEKDPREVIDAWVDWAKKNRMLVLVPSIFPREGIVPTAVDEWLFDIKREVSERYRIDPAQILLVGLEHGSYYAAYLGLSYPEEFSAAALLRGELPGSFEKLMKPSSSKEKQIPLYVVLDRAAEASPRAETWAIELEKKGYRVTLDLQGSGEDLSAIRQRMMGWFEQDLESRRALKERPRRTFKEKWNGFVKDFFEV